MYLTFRKCDCCGVTLQMPGSYTQENNPFKGWVAINFDDEFLRRDFCPNCVSEGKAQNFIASKRAGNV